MNNVILVGRLTKNPELRYTPQGDMAITRFTLAVDRAKKEDGADFIPIKCFGRQAETANQYLSKGRQCAVQGYIRVDSYEKDGKRVWNTEVIANRVEFMGAGQDTSSQTEFDGGGYIPANFEKIEDDIPF